MPAHLLAEVEETPTTPQTSSTANAAPQQIGADEAAAAAVAVAAGTSSTGSEGLSLFLIDSNPAEGSSPVTTTTNVYLKTVVRETSWCGPTPEYHKPHVLFLIPS